jgi:hypothetical protein
MMINIVNNTNSFDPSNMTHISINGTEYEILRVADYDTAPKKRKAGRSFVCKLKDPNGNLYALKYYQPNVATVLQGHDFKQAFDKQNDVLADIPSFEWTKRRTYISENNPIVQQYPNLSHAILMPWISGYTVSSFRQKIRIQLDGQEPTAPLQPVVVMQIVTNLLQSLVMLEQCSCAHGDICSDNVIILDDWSVKIIDIDEMYISNLMQPATLDELGSGHDGYRFPHRFSSWAAEADRFSTAMLIAEILTLQDRDAAGIGALESLFTTHTPATANNAHTQVNNYNDTKQRIIDHFGRAYPLCENLIKRVFAAATLNDCPTLNAWLDALQPQPIQPPTPISPPPSTPVSPLPQTDIWYTKRASSDFPVLIIFVLDISQSMYLPQEHLMGHRRIDVALETMNNIIIGFRESCIENTSIRPRYHFAYFCYHRSVINMFNEQHRKSIIHIDQFTSERPFDIESLNQVNPDGARSISGAYTNMSAALTTLHDFLRTAIRLYHQSHPPFIIHITDGYNTGDEQTLNKSFAAISALTTMYGSPLVCSLYINGEQDLGFVTENTEINGSGEYIDAVRTLIRISSLIPRPYRLRHRNQQILDTARFVFSYRSNSGIINEFLDIATGTGAGTGT